MPVFNYRFRVQASLESVSEFHFQTGILKKLTPPLMIMQVHRFDPLDIHAEIARRAAGVLQRSLQRLAGEIVQAAFGMTAEHGHGDAGDVDLGQGTSGGRVPGCAARV